MMDLRRIFLIFTIVVCAVLGLSGCAGNSGDRPPILFVHGNGDTAALWYPTMWRFESHGYDRRLLFAIDFPYPLARTDDRVPQEGRSSTADQMAQIGAKVDSVLAWTGYEKLVLIGSSRGGNAIRNYLKNGGGAAHVSRAVLCGTPNHGVVASDRIMIGSEFNGAQPFLRGLNAGSEVAPGVAFMTLRSDTNDKYAQPDGAVLGFPGVPTGVGYDGPALKGARNIVIPKLDHREVAFHPLAFGYMYAFITGTEPAGLDIVPEARPVLNGKVNGMHGLEPTNIGVAGAKVEIYEVAPDTGERSGPAVHRKITGPGGLWGPFSAKPDAYYEFVVVVEGYPITHIYRSPFPRSSEVIHLRPGAFAEGDGAAGSVVIMRRPRGYFGRGRDTILLDGRTPPEIPEGVPRVSSVKRVFEPGPARSVRAVFNDETITVRTWPAPDDHLVIAEFHY